MWKSLFWQPRPLNPPLITQHLALSTQIIFPSKLVFSLFIKKSFLIQQTVLACILRQFHSNPSPTLTPSFIFFPFIYLCLIVLSAWWGWNSSVYRSHKHTKIHSATPSAVTGERWFQFRGCACLFVCSVICFFRQKTRFWNCPCFSDLV